ncbi:MAG: hypothetical protein JOY66_09860 [Acetobacteraceae bacterium]|nr:hypothetical protein [Acetobacteraceae bacterium]
MPFEMRQIVFRMPEVAQAVTEWHRRMRTPLPAGTVVRCTAEGDAPDDAPRVRLVIALDDLEAVHRGGSHREVVIDGPALAAALILYCRDRRIPLPASAKKSLRRVGEQVGLVVTSGLTGSWRG